MILEGPLRFFACIKPVHRLHVAVRLVDEENVTHFLNECFLRTMKHEKSVMRTNIQDFRTISGTFLYPNPDC